MYLLVFRTESLDYVSLNDVTVAALSQPISAGVDVNVTYVARPLITNDLCSFAYLPNVGGRKKRQLTGPHSGKIKSA